MRVALFASPAFALKSLEALNEHHNVVLVVSQEDKPVGRGLKMRSPVIAERARELGIGLEQPRRLRNNREFFQLIRDLQLDVAVTAAYGKILPKELLDIPKHGFLNIHASLLPKYRGAAPIQWAILNGEQETGISIMQTDTGLDTGPIRHIKKIKITAEDNALTMFEKLADLGAVAIIEALDLLEKRNLLTVAQNDRKSSLAPMLKKADGNIRWNETAEQINNRYRAMLAWPKTQTKIKRKILKVHEMQVVKENGEPGKIIRIDDTGVLVGTAQNSILLQTVQPASKPKMSAHSWANGYKIKVGDQFA